MAPDISESNVNAENLALVYIAAEVSEAEKVRDLLDAQQIEHFTQLQDFRTTNPLTEFFRTANGQGIAFLVMKERAKEVRDVLRRERLTAGAIDDES